MKKTGKRPKAAPWAAASAASLAGIPHSATAITSEEASASAADRSTLILATARQTKMTVSGTAAMAAEAPIPPPIGAVLCIQGMTTPGVRSFRKEFGALERQEAGLCPDAARPREAGHLIPRRDDPVAGHEERPRVGREGHAHGAGRLRAERQGL